MRRLATLAFCLGMTMVLDGCRHRPHIAPLPPVQQPVELDKVPPPLPDDELPMVEAPQVKLPPVPFAAAAARPRRERKKPAKPVVATAPVAEPNAAPEAAIGALTAGGEANPQAKQEAEELIASIEKRLNGLPAQMSEEKKAQVGKVRNFWRDAQEAMKSGDAEGAKTLATKAKLLLDDLEK